MRARVVLCVVVGLVTCACGGGAAAPTAPTPPPLAPVPVTPGRHAVTMAGDGITQGGLLYLPAGGAPRPAIILLHGWQPPGTNGAAVREGRATRLHGW
jgi:hypothetical protein